MKKSKKFLLFVVLAVFLFSCIGLNAGAAPPVENQRVNVLIGFENKPDVQLVQRFGGEIYMELDLVPVIAAKMNPRSAEALAKNPNVRYVEPDGKVYALEQEVPWGINRVFGNETYSFSTWNDSSGLGIKVAILDTGIDKEHEDIDVADGVNFSTSSNDNYDYDYYDTQGHGTHVAGTVAALNNDLGVVGVAPDVNLYAVKVLDDSGSGTWSSVAAGIDWAVTNDIKIINMSLGGGYSETLEKACNAAYNKGLLLVAAAGNSGNVPGRGDNVIYPAKYQSVIAVAASDSRDKRASFSSTGPDVEIIAPGVSILSTIPGNKYGNKSGTSMSSPHAAGVAALVWSANPELSNLQVREILQETAENLGLSSNHQGHGLVRADLAVAAAPGQEPGDEPEDDSGDEVVLAPIKEVNVTTDKETYKIGDTVIITVKATSNDNDNNNPVEGADINITITTASGRIYTGSGTTNSSGEAIFSFKTKRPDGIGDYTVIATASKDGSKESGSTTFKVN